MTIIGLFLGFLRVGCFAFGGAYGAIPLIREVVLSYGWITDEALTRMIAISESTPGPIMVNLATYVGSSQAGLPGAVVATLAVVLPSFVIILLAMAVLQNLLGSPYVQAVLRGMKPCIIGIILATGLFMTARCCFPMNADAAVDLRALLMAALLAASGLLHRRMTKKKLSPIALIVLSAVLGAIAYGV